MCHRSGIFRKQQPFYNEFRAVAFISFLCRLDCGIRNLFCGSGLRGICQLLSGLCRGFRLVWWHNFLVWVYRGDEFHELFKQDFFGTTSSQ